MNVQSENSRRLLCRWLGWFFALNIGVLCLLGLMYLPFIPSFNGGLFITHAGTLTAWIFTVFAFIGQFSIFGFVACAIAMLATLLIPKKSISMLFAILLSSFLVLFILTDVMVYHLYHFHFGSVFWHILRSGAISEVLVFSTREWVISVSVVVLVVCAEIILSRLTWRWVSRTKKRGHGFSVAVGLLGSVLISYAIYMGSLPQNGSGKELAKSSNAHLIVMAAKIVPYYNATLGLLIPEKNAQAQLAMIDDGYFAQNKQVNKKLNYPTHLLQVHGEKHHLNIVMITIDTWRFDAMNKKITPNIDAFAQQSLQFEDHISGGNCTRPGIFSMFYGIPANYWTAMQSQETGPLLIHELLKQHYQMGIYASASLQYPAFNQTVFRQVPNLQVDTPGNSSAQRDAKITQEFKQFVAKRNTNKPFFSFLFYDEVHNWCGSDQPYAKPFQPAVKVCDRLVLDKDTNPVPYLNRYDNAAHYVDGLVGQVLNTLKQKHLLKNTIVVITADHGEEFNDENLGYWGHASAFDRYQVHVPMIVYWPGMQPRKIGYATSHFDIVPTLMQQVLGVTNTLPSYTVGQSLFTKGKRPFYIVGSYVDYAVLQPKRINVFYSGGNYDIQNRDGQELQDATIDSHALNASFKQLNRFFK
ncbi:MAG: DUF3413 domain-containing protein [Gammaproteobacteria bacterium]|nr:DUF3413 domain-containing protein [Gammaproteobacteria bacterium]